MRIWREGTYRPHGYKKNVTKSGFAKLVAVVPLTTNTVRTPHHRLFCAQPHVPIEALPSTYHYKPHFCLHLTLSSKSPYSQALTLISSAPLRGVAAYCLQDAVRSSRVPGRYPTVPSRPSNHTASKQRSGRNTGSKWGRNGERGVKKCTKCKVSKAQMCAFTVFRQLPSPSRPAKPSSF